MGSLLRYDMGQTNPRYIRLDRCNQVDIKNASYEFTDIFLLLLGGFDLAFLTMGIFHCDFPVFKK